MSLLVAILAAQACEMPQCFAVPAVDAGIVRGVTISSNAVFARDMTLDGDLRAPWAFAGTVFVSGYLQAQTAGALYLRVTRLPGDGNAGVVVLESNDRPGDSAALSVFSHGSETLRFTTGGSVRANAAFGDGGMVSVFTDVSGGVAGTLGCQGAPTGCQVSINGGVINNSVHPAVAFGNNHGRTDRAGGVQLGVSGASNSDNLHAGGVFAVDAQGNTRVGKMVITRLRTENFPTCLLKTDFDNSSSTSNDGTGTFNGVVGSMAFNIDTEQLWLCTTRSAIADGGYEHIGGSL